MDLRLASISFLERTILFYLLGRSLWAAKTKIKNCQNCFFSPVSCFLVSSGRKKTKNTKKHELFFFVFVSAGPIWRKSRSIFSGENRQNKMNKTDLF
jgi:hypothetical protein